MKKCIMKKIMPLICVAAITLCSCGLTKKDEEVPKVEVSETVYGIEWGSSVEDVKGKMAEEGLEERSLPDGLSVEMCAYNVKDYNGTKGANGNIMYTFDEKGKLSTVNIYIKTSEGTDSELISKLKKSYDKAFTSTLYKRIDLGDVSGAESIYWLGVKSIVFISYDSGKALTISYTDRQSQPGMAAELEKR